MLCSHCIYLNRDLERNAINYIHHFYSTIHTYFLGIICPKVFCLLLLSTAHCAFSTYNRGTYFFQLPFTQRNSPLATNRTANTAGETWEECTALKGFIT